MNEPLTKHQQSLRGRSLKDMTVDQLREWIDACDKMERWVKASKARRTWTRSRDEALAELERRESVSRVSVR